jgi:CRISPR-associated endonuclease/helicase Cas3
MREFPEVFKAITGYEHYDFQYKITETILSGKNLILKAPTGSGKTWSALVPFIMAVENCLPFPQKMIYSLPLRTLANSLYKTVSENEYIQEKNIEVSLQTGESPSDRFFESDIIFTTIDQTLSSILMFPYSLPQKLANINAGAILSSYLVFDEFHLLDPGRSFSTTVNILKKLKGITPFCLMTATLSKDVLDELALYLDADIISLSENEVQNLKNYNNPKTIFVHSDHLMVESIIQLHRKRSIIITNTVDRCQEIYHLLNEKRIEGTEIICIHSHFFENDRKEKEDKIKELFGEGSKSNAILVSTQVIEVGIDISCEIMHTEISPINSLIQRAGRCARFENEAGQLHVYNIKPDNDGKVKYLPYSSKLCELTFKELSIKNGANLDYFISQEIIDRVLTETELKDFEGVKCGKEFSIYKAWSSKDKRLGRDLIRDINSVSLILMPDKNFDYDSPFNYETLSVNPYSLRSKLNDMNVSNGDWLVATIEENNFIDSFESDYTFKSIDLEQIDYINPIIVNSNYASYSKKIGLNFLNIGSGYHSKKVPKNKEIPKYSYKKDTYQKHITSMIRVYDQKYKPKEEYTFLKLQNIIAEQISPLPFSIDEIIKFIIILHDYGKLNLKWQEIAVSFQKTKGYSEGEVLAHTDFDAGKDKSLKFPPHAGIGAMVALSLIEEMVEDKVLCEILTESVSTAIIHHHSVNTVNSIPYTIIDKNIVLELIRKYCPSLSGFDPDKELLERWENTESLENFLVTYESDIGNFLYFMFARILRLCDQKSFEINGD